jgi:GH25 family lysozyme M1 (1,4-beta-N-acetylmuramidase)
MKKQLLFILFLCIFGINIQAQTILGVDVSSYEGTINWSSVKAAGYTFAFAKASEGVTITDSYFTGNQVNGVAAGMIMGAYHFARPENNSATAEANYFLSVAGSYIKSCYLPPVLDVEDPPSGPALATFFTSAQLTTWIQTWMTTVQNATGIAPIIYIGPHNAAFVNSSLNVYGLWIDDYNSSQTAPPPNIGVWTNWDFKQYSWTGTVPGISGSSNIDMDVFHGTMNQFNTLIGCNAVLADFTSNVKSVCPGSTINFTDRSTTTGSLSGWNWTFSGGSPPTSSLQNPSVIYNSPGIYSVKETVTSTAGADSVTYLAYIDVAPTAALPLAENFQSSTFPPAGWYLNLPGFTDSTWHLCTTTGHNSSQCMYFSANCGQSVNITGERQQLYTPNYNFSTATKPRLWFDVAYEPSHVPTYSDTLVIYYSTDCGGTWNSIYSKGGMTLCTTGSSTNAGTDTAGSHGKGCFIPPNSGAWRTDSINLTVLIGQPKVMFSFESRSGWGNILYLDNINISDNVSTAVTDISEEKDVKVFPNPNNGSFSFALSDHLTEKAYLKIYDLPGQSVYDAPVHSGMTQVTLEVKPGVYFYRIMTETGDRVISEGKLLIQQ